MTPQTATACAASAIRTKSVPWNPRRRIIPCALALDRSAEGLPAYQADKHGDGKPDDAILHQRDLFALPRDGENPKREHRRAPERLNRRERENELAEAADLWPTEIDYRARSRRRLHNRSECGRGIAGIAGIAGITLVAGTGAPFCEGAARGGS